MDMDPEACYDMYDIDSREAFSRLTEAAMEVSSGVPEDADSSEPIASHTKYSLRARSLQKRREVEVKQNEPKSGKRRPKSRPAPLSKYRRKTANAKERGRMRDINGAFEMLERCIPQLTARCPSTEKVTKITVLRLAINYINSLSSMLSGDGSESVGSPSSSSTSCPDQLSDQLPDPLDDIGDLTDFQLPHDLVLLLQIPTHQSSYQRSSDFSPLPDH